MGNIQLEETRAFVCVAITDICLRALCEVSLSTENKTSHSIYGHTFEFHPTVIAL